VALGAEEPEVVRLVDQAAAGDRAAFAALYERFLDPVYRYFYYRTGQRSEAEDLTEQVFLKAWEALGKFRWQGRPFLAWLYRLAHNLHADHLRRRRPAVPLDSETSHEALVDQRAASQLARTVDADLLTRGIRQLTPDQQQVILLRFAQGLDTAQIANVLDKHEGAVRALQMRALQRLRQVLAPEGEAESR
jgi:RNA polymerase sigma-70 factor (ECF subfamily)